MKSLRKLGAACALISVLGVSAFAGQILTPCDPGPPIAPSDLSSVTPTSSGEVVTANSEPSFTEIAADLLLNFLPLF